MKIASQDLRVAAPSFWRVLPARLAAKAYGPHALSHDDPQHYRTLVESLFSSPTSMIMSNFVGAMIPLFCWQSSSDAVFVPILGFALAIFLFRLSTVLRYRWAKPSEQTHRQVIAWDREYFFGATSYSMVLGAMSYAALALTDDIACHIITIVCVIAFSSGYVARNSGRPIFVIVQLICLCVPVCVGLLQAGHHFYPYISIFISLFILTNIAIAFSLNRNLLELAAAHKRSDTLAATLRTKNITLDSALNSMTHGLATFGAEATLEVSNLRFAELYRLRPEQVAPGTPLTDLLDALIESRVLTATSARELAEACRGTLRSRQPSSVELETDRGDIFAVSVEVTGDDGVLMLTENATDRKAAAAQIERMAHTDSLTGLANRFQFTQVLRRACGNSAATRTPFAVFYIDLDNFKTINDTLGHEAGDILLVQVAERLQALVGETELVARFGGDEFLLLSTADTPERARHAGARIVSAMELPFAVGAAIIHVTTSVGIALVPQHGTDPSEVLRDADMALYSAKAAGRNTIMVFEPNIATALNDRRRLEQDLRSAFREHKLRLHYQPIVNLGSGDPVSYEALMRWEDPVRGFVPPSAFIPVAEQTGLIADMGEWAIRQACVQARGWAGEASVAVNVSAIQFRDTERLIAAVKDALLVSGLPASRLELEVTESLLIEDQDASLEAIKELRKIGVRFSLDDFGSGYSSLAYLARYPFSKVKIDRSFAQHVATDGPSRAIIEVVCQLAHRMGMRVVVEGIETEAQRREVEALGAEEAQGFLFGRPRAEILSDCRRDAA